MSNKRIVFDEESAVRIGRAVAAVEAMGTVEQPGTPQERAWIPPGQWHYRITANNGSGSYTVRRLDWKADNSGFADIAATLDPQYNVNLTAYDVRLRTGGAVSTAPVPGWWLHVNGAWVLLIDIQAAMGMFPVKCWQDGGTTDGDQTSQCDRTYTVRTIEATGPSAGGTLLGSGKTPQRVRSTIGMYLCPPATGGGVIGMGYYDAAGAFHLYDANETQEQDPCDEVT